MLLAQNDMRYTAPVHDPWFFANGTFAFTYANNSFTLPDRYISPLVCAQKYFLCNPSSPRHLCTPPGGLLQLGTHLTDMDATTNLEFNPAQEATAARLLRALAEISMFHAVSALSGGGGSAGALRAQGLAVLNISPGLPDDQWSSEVEGWFQMNLARLQAEVVEFAVKGGGSLFESRLGGKLRLWPLTREQREQCGNQLVRAVGEVQNFSLVGVLVVVCVCGVLVVVDLVLERVVDLVGVWFNGRRPVSSAVEVRRADGKLHLLRVALAGASREGMDWVLGRWSVPVTGRGDGVERFDICAHSDSNGLAAYKQSAGFTQETVEEGPGGETDGGERRGLAQHSKVPSRQRVEARDMDFALIVDTFGNRVMYNRRYSAS
jgi:hypothetical protein